MMTPAQIERNLKLTGGKTVVKGVQTTYGHLQWAPFTAVRQDGHGGVLTADGKVTVANGVLTGVSQEDGIGDAVTVDISRFGETANPVACVIVDIVPTPNEPDGDTLDLVIRRA